MIDVRDLAQWLLHMIDGKQAGTYNVVGPAQPLTMGGFLESCREATGIEASFTWVGDKFLIEKGLRPAEIPLWAPASGGPRFTASNRRALGAGLSLRPLADTITDTLIWEQAHPQPISFSREQERLLLLEWHATAART
jgi:2'-hydroxyisoflavone reductase